MEWVNLNLSSHIRFQQHSKSSKYKYATYNITREIGFTVFSFFNTLWFSFPGEWKSLGQVRPIVNCWTSSSQVLIHHHPDQISTLVNFLGTFFYYKFTFFRVLLNFNILWCIWYWNWYWYLMYLKCICGFLTLFKLDSGQVAISRVKFDPKQESDCLDNFKIICSIFTKLNIDKVIMRFCYLG